MRSILSVVAAATLAASVQGKAPLGSFYVPPMEHVFEERKPMPTALSDMTTNSVGSDRILLVGGCVAEVQNSTGCEQITDVARFYFPATETFKTVKNGMPVARSRHGAAIRNNKLYVIGGEGPVSGEYPLVINVLDLETEVWTTITAELPKPISDAVAFEYEGLIYFTGGYLPKEEYAMNTVTYSIDLNDNLRTDGPALKTPRGDSRAEVLNDKVYIIGGFDATFQPLSSMETFDGDSWTTHPVPMDVARGDLATAVLDGMIYAFGGETVTNGAGTVTGRVEIFDPSDSENGNWHHAGELDTNRHRFDASGLGNVVYVFGGQKLERFKGNGVFESDHDILNTIEAFVQQADLYSSPTITVHGSGTTNPEYFFYNVMNSFERMSRLPVKMTYRGVGSSTGQDEFVGNERSSYLPINQFGSGDIPLTKAKFDQVTKHGHKVAQIPFTFGAVAFYVNVPEAEGEKVILEGCQAAQIFNGKIKKWSELASNGRNEFLKGVDQEILTAHRLLGSSSTSGITSYLNAACPSEWPKELVKSEIKVWPCDDPANKCKSVSKQGSGGVQTYLEDTPYSIGYLSVSHGFPAHIQPVKLVNANNKIVEPNQESIQAAGSSYNGWPASIYEDFSKVTLINAAGDKVWPIVLVSYIYVRQDLSGMGTAGALLKAFIEYILSTKEDGTKEFPKGQELLTAYDFVGLPSAVLSKFKSGLSELELAYNVEEFVFEESTTKSDGQQPFVLSYKRGNFDDYYRKSTNTQINSLQSSLESVSAPSGTNEGNAKSIAIAALIFAIVDLIVLLLLLRMIYGFKKAVEGRVMTRNGSSKQQQRENSQDFSQDRSDSEHSQSAAVQVQLV